MDLEMLSTDCCPPASTPRPLAADERHRLVTMFRALGDPTRLEVLRLIAAQPEPLCVCDVVSQFNVSQPTISHHLKVLREAGLVVVSRRGTWAYYAVDPRGLEALRSVSDQLVPKEVASVY
jgi:DNA-binding transcriptional ArsR family regulator